MSYFGGHGKILKYRLSVWVLIMRNYNGINGEVDMNVSFSLILKRYFALEYSLENN